MDAGTGQTVAASLTAEVDDGAEAGGLPDQVAGPVATFVADGGRDQDSMSAAAAERRPEAAVVVPPRTTAVASDTAQAAPTQRGTTSSTSNQEVRREPRGSPDIAEHGRMAWHRASGCTRRALVEAAVARGKQVIGDGLRTHTDERRATEVKVAVHAINRMLEFGRPNHVRVA